MIGHSICLVLTILEKCRLFDACLGLLRSAQLHIYTFTRACKPESLDTSCLSSLEVRGLLETKQMQPLGGHDCTLNYLPCPLMLFFFPKHRILADMNICQGGAVKFIFTYFPADSLDFVFTNSPLLYS